MTRGRPGTAVRAALRRSSIAFTISQARLRIEARHGLPQGSIRAIPSTRERLVALSYDDGPSPANTPELLEMLDEADARATFFVVGSEAQRHPELTARIAAAGHELANHTYSHPHPRDLDDSELKRELERTNHAIAAAGTASRLFRVPYGKRSRAAARVCSELGLTSVLWSVDSGDTRPFPTTRIVREVVGRVKPGDIVLFHDGGDRRPRTLDATRTALEKLGERGYGFVTISELLDRTAGA
jgi:peptidoglycan/xylan/chitin deacetylase (PgdA/CDA1 family)